MFDISNLITAVCAVLGVLGGFFMWLHNIAQLRMAEIQFQLVPEIAFADEERQMLKIILMPQRRRFPYKIERIETPFPIYQADYLNEEIIAIDKPFTLNMPIFIPSSLQKLAKEPQFELFIDSDLLEKPNQYVHIFSRSHYFPFKWGKRIVLS